MLKNRRQYFNIQICTTELKKLSPFLKGKNVPNCKG